MNRHLTIGLADGSTQQRLEIVSAMRAKSPRPQTLTVMSRMKSIKISAICSLGFSLIFGLLSAIFYFGDWTRLFFVTFFGFFFGLIAAPEIEPKAFKKAWLFQTISGLLAGVFASKALNLNAEGIMAAVVIGGLLGWSAPMWVKHVQIP